MARKRVIRGDLCGDNPPQWVHDTVKRLANQPSAAITLPVKRITPAHIRALEERGLIATWSISRMISPTKRSKLEEVVTDYCTLTESGQMLARRIPDPTGGLSDPEVCPDPSRTIVRDGRREDARQAKLRKRRKAASLGSTTSASGGSSAA